MITGPKGRAGRGRLLRGAFSGQFPHNEAQVERGDAAEITFLVIDPAAQGGAPQAPAVQNVGEAPLKLSAAFFEQGFAAFAFHGTGGIGHGPPGFGLEVSWAGGGRRWDRR